MKNKKTRPLGLIAVLVYLLSLTPANAAVDNSYKTGTGTSERVYLNGTYVQAGLALNGRFGPSGAAPTIGGVTWHPSGGRSNLGFVADRSRDGTWLDTDFFYPGNPLEGWGVRFDGTQYSYDGGDAGAGATFSFSDVEVTSGTASVTHTSTFTDLTVEQTYTVGIGSGTFTNDQNIMVSVRITNTGASSISSLWYARHFDPDNLKDIPGGNYITTNKIMAQRSEGASYSLVRATKSDTRQTPAGTSYIGYLSTDARSQVSYGGFGIPADLRDLFIDGADVGLGLTAETTVGSETTHDEALSLGFDLQSLAAGASTTFTWSYVLSQTAANDAAGTDTTAVVSDSSESATTVQPSSLLTFATNGADNNSFPQSEIKGTTVKLWKNVLTRAGYIFTGWNTKADGTGTSYGDQASFNFDADFITLYAQWSLIKTTPTITWANPAYITTATPLSATQLNATASVPGTCTYTPALGATLPAGKQILTCLFTPTDTTKYSTVSKSVEIEVLAIPTLTWANPASIKSGTALSATQLNATASAAGSFTYQPTLGAVLKPGKQTLKVTFTPTDTRLSPITKEVTIEITPALNPAAEAITTVTGGSNSGAITQTTTDATVVIKTLGVGIEKASATANQLTVFAKSDYSGKTTVVITVNDEARSVDLTVPVTVNPAAVAQGSFTIISALSSSATWQAASGAKSYLLSLDGKEICTSATTSCQIPSLTGPASKVVVKSLGADETSSADKALAFEKPATPIEITSINFATAKSTLTKSAKSKLNAFASQVSALGLNTLVIQGHTDSVGGIDNQALSNARAQAAAKYLRSKLANVKISVKGFGPNEPIADNESDEGRAQNRRAGVYIGG